MSLAMNRRYLFGPVSLAFGDHNLYRARQAGECLAFDAAGATDLMVGPADNWEVVCQRLPAGWVPDFLVLYLPAKKRGHRLRQESLGKEDDM